MNGPAPRLAARLLPYALAFASSLCLMVLELVASRLVARHVGVSLSVWTSVIGIMLGGICLGNVLGGRLADRFEPRRLLAPLYALATALTLGSLWMNAAVGPLARVESLPWDVRTVLVVTLDFLVPATVLGLVSPIVAKIAVEQARLAGSALGDVYFWGAVGSIVGTFVAGFYLIYLAQTSTIVTVVAAALALLAAAMGGGLVALLGLAVAALLGLGSVEPTTGMLALPGVYLGSVKVNALALAGHLGAVVLAVAGLARLRGARLPAEEQPEPMPEGWPEARLGDLAVLAFIASLTFMALEMVAGRMVQRHLGSSIYGWTSVIIVLLGGLSLGNLIGGKLADRVQEERHASWLFLVASAFTLAILLLETPPIWLGKVLKDPFPSEPSAVLHRAQMMSGMEWGARVLLVTASVFLLPAAAMGTVSPVVAKLAVERLRRTKRTGTAIGQVYAWGMVGSILGTFLTGFVLIDVLGTKGLVLALGTALALAATALGTVWHAAWAGLPLGLCIIAFFPGAWFQKLGEGWGIREPGGDLAVTAEGLAYADESDYYYIKVDNTPDPEGQLRTLVLDNLIHGYFILGHPERLDYDYEHIYALVTHRVAAAKAKAAGGDVRDVPLRTMFLGGGSYTFPRYLQSRYPKTAADVAEIDPAVTRANWAALGLPRDTTIRTTWGDARQFVERNQATKQYDLIFGDAFNDFSVPWHLTTREFNAMLSRMLAPDGVYMINIIDVYEDMEAAEERGRDEARDEARRAARDRAKAGGASDEKVAEAEAAAEPTEAEVARAVARARREAKEYGGFLGAWVETARKTFPYLYVYGTNARPGEGGRETFVVVASKAPLDLDDLGGREGDPEFFDNGELYQPRHYGPGPMKDLAERSRGVILTDDYAPVENLLAPVAATRGKE